MLPVIANFVVFHYIPMYGVQIAFRNYNIVRGMSGSPWIGFRNFVDFFSSFYFWEVLRNTLVISLYAIVFGFPAPIIFALILNEAKSVRYKRFVQTVSYMPHFISSVIVAGMVIMILSPSMGIANEIVERFGGERTAFLEQPQYFRSIYVTMLIWKELGFSAIIYLAAIVQIDPQLYEAATIDGAGRMRRMWHITIAGIRSTIIILFILRLGGILNVGWMEILLLQNPLNTDTSEVIQTFVYKRGLINRDYSYATAVGLFQSVVAFFFIVTANKISKKVSEVYIF